MSLKHGLLGLLNYGSMTGYELDKIFNDSLGFFWQGKTSQIYRELNAMEKCAWLSSEHVVQDDKPNKKIYTITDSGKSELLTWLSDKRIVEDYTKIRSSFLMRIFFAGETNEQSTVSFIQQFRGTHLTKLEKMRDVPQNVADYGSLVGDETKSRYWQLTALFGKHYYKACIEWANEALAILEERE